ncbi:MAG TPA: D-arabinono-1,4-lactone oxidase [Agitococcus sp.]|nr:D-arabinono-1,4-lactone oxidase [Agitococcus sp.]
MLNRRQFLGFTAASSASLMLPACYKAPAKIIPAAQDAQGHYIWQNWSGSEHAYPSQRLAPNTLDELKTTLANATAPIRCVGAGHSFNGQCATNGTLLALDNFSGLVSHDEAKNTAVIKAGTRLQQLGQLLESIGQDMVNIPDVNKQTLAGAIATGTHGSGYTLPALHGRVQSFKLLTVQGQELNCSTSQNTDIFHAALVGLGSFGVVTEYTLENWPLAYTERQVTMLPLESLLAEWSDLYQKNRNAEFFYIPFTGLAMKVLHNQTTKAVTPRGVDKDMDSLMDLKKLRDYVGWSPSLRKRIAQMVADNHGTEYAVDYAWKLLASERSVRFHEMEYHLPLDAQLPALKEVIAVIESQRHDVFFPIEARVIKGDENAWLSPFYQQDTGSIAVHAYYEDDYQFLYTLIEPILKRYGGRPHWGKLHSLSDKDFALLYPQWQQVKAIRQQLDPQGKLLNSYTQKIWGVA